MLGLGLLLEIEEATLLVPLSEGASEEVLGALVIKDDASVSAYSLVLSAFSSDVGLSPLTDLRVRCFCTRLPVVGTETPGSAAPEGQAHFASTDKSQ